MDDNQEVEHTSGVSRFCNSLVCAFCVAPVLALGSVFMLGWNEQRAVCEAKAITEGEENVVQLTSCNSSTQEAGELVLFTCPLLKDGISPLTAPNSDFSSVISYVGTGLSISAEMYQCVEQVSSSTEKDSVGGGTTTVKTYTYSREWSSSHVDSSSFAMKDSDSYRANCDANNPAWPGGLPSSGVAYAPSVKAGAFTIEENYVSSVPLDTTVEASSTPENWTWTGEEYESNKWTVGSKNIGQVRVSFKGTDWSAPDVTVLGKNDNGVVRAWTAPDDWLCSGFTLSQLRMGTVDVDTFFADLQAASNAVTYVLRVVGFLLIWFALSRLGGPLGVAADCIPCVGPYLGDAVESIVCCVTCPPACGCALGVIGIVWVVMRPTVGIPLMVIFLCTCGGFIGYTVYAKMKKKSGDESGAGGEVYGNQEES